ncbi:MAG: UTP--glucose-1-phosphate uridylyltransferase [Planctomycetes bacterium]|nr:UTP--glucose-1-phosphate uridylyltransferase [Planctomycetota bacterium]
MTSLNRELVTQIRKRFCDAGQGHVFTWWDELTAEEREGLFRQLTTIDLELMQRLVEENLTDKEEKDSRTFEPMAIIPLPSNEEEKSFRARAFVEGESILRQGKCAAFLMAGSMDRDAGAMGTRGFHPITPVSGKSLFQLHAEKVLAARRRYEVDIPLFIMTSAGNYEEIQTFFENHNYFGLPGEDVFFFMQGMLPAVDLSGKFFMEERGKVWMGPDGHGGSIRSLYTSGARRDGAPW